MRIDRLTLPQGRLQRAGYDLHRPDLTTLPERDVLAIDGAGATESPAFQAAIGALYAARARLGGDGDVPLEGTYWQRDGGEFDLIKSD
jgi:hypothetical protein